MTQVNFGFISQLEGGPVLKGYVPEPEYSSSGVTIATGFDLGQRSADEVMQMLPVSLARKLSPYCGQKKRAAVRTLNALPLQITAGEAELIDLCVKRQLLDKLQHRYNRDSAVPFDQLSEPQQTVIASVAFQYGDLARRCPKFWQSATGQHWTQLGIELRDFGDCYHTRRHREANYLDTVRA
jgi:hypothetical protein